MPQRIYIKVVGFSDEERHALNTIFRLSEELPTVYQLWTPEADEPAKMAFYDGQSWEARVDAESPLNEHLKIMWVGGDPHPRTWRAFQRPLSWPDIVQSIELVFRPATDVDLDLGGSEGEAPSAEQMQNKRALIVGPIRNDRLYLRARLALASLTQADDAESGNHALELARDNQYDVALVDFRLPDMQALDLVRELRQGKLSIRHIAVTKADRSMPERVRAWMAGAEALLDKPPHPRRLNELLKRV
jgi:CheY-like chemotaxis protein